MISENLAPDKKTPNLARTRPGFVYLVEKTGGLIKYGATANPDQRLRQYKTLDPTCKLVYCEFTQNMRKSENELRELFRPYQATPGPGRECITLNKPKAFALLTANEQIKKGELTSKNMLDLHPEISNLILRYRLPCGIYVDKVAHVTCVRTTHKTDRQLSEMGLMITSGSDGRPPKIIIQNPKKLVATIEKLAKFEKLLKHIGPISVAEQCVSSQKLTEKGRTGVLPRM